MKRTGIRRPSYEEAMEKLRSKPRRPLKRATSPKVKSKPKKRGKTTLQKLKARLWSLCRELTRKKYGNTCYTCGRTGLEGSNWQTGHFVSSSVCSVELRYSLDNLRPQCYNCNINKSGNWVAFEEHLRRDGVDTEALKQRNRDTQGKQYDIPYYEAKISEYENL